MRDGDRSTTQAPADDWEQHWQRFADSAQFNPAQAYRRKIILAALVSGNPVSPMRILDVGSGQGDLAMELRRHFPEAQIIGVELSSQGVATASAKAPEVRFLQRDLLQEAPIPEGLEGWATHAVCSEVLEHVEDPERLLRNAAVFMARGCRLVVTVPGGPRSQFDRHIGHRMHYRSSQLSGLLRSAGFVPEYVGGAGFPFFNLYKLVVIARGQRLIRDVSARAPGNPPSRLARFAMGVFAWLFRANLPPTPFGWQMIGVSRKV